MSECPYCRPHPEMLVDSPIAGKAAMAENGVPVLVALSPGADIRDVVVFPVNYCPMCGRDLHKEDK